MASIACSLSQLFFDFMLLDCILHLSPQLILQWHCTLTSAISLKPKQVSCVLRALQKSQGCLHFMQEQPTKVVPDSRFLLSWSSWLELQSEAIMVFACNKLHSYKQLWRLSLTAETLYKAFGTEVTFDLSHTRTEDVCVWAAQTWEIGAL